MAQIVDQSIPVQVRSGQVSLYRRDGLICALLIGICLLVARPFVEMGVDDDWSYIKTVQIFAQTGHFVYNGWATATLGWQILWGALFSKILGFSFVHVRISTLPVALATVYTFHQILVRFGVKRTYAMFGTLALGLSPVFLPMSATYMTDIPGLFCTLLCLYLCQRALWAVTDVTAFVWLSLATATSVIGGTARQVVWLGVVTIVPSAIWLLRSRRKLFWSGALLCLIGVASAFACMHWLYGQPYFLPESVPVKSFGAAALKTGMLNGTRAFFCLLLLLFPVLTAWTRSARSLPRRFLFVASLTASVLLTALLIHWSRNNSLDKWTAPWLPHVIAALRDGGVGNVPGEGPAMLADWQRIVVTVLVDGSALMFFLDLFCRLRSRRHLRQIANEPAWRDMFFLLAPYTVAYVAAISLQAPITLFDRYMLPLQAVATIFLLRYYQEFVATDANKPVFRFAIWRVPVASQLSLLLIAYYVIAGTHDWFAVNRARVDAAEEVRRSGVPRTAIQGGFEYDGWTQLEAAGYMNDVRIRKPPGVYHEVALSPDPQTACAATWFDPSVVPSVVPQFFIVSAPLSCLASAPFNAVTYHAWMPPFTRRLYIQQRTK